MGDFISSFFSVFFSVLGGAGGLFGSEPEPPPPPPAPVLPAAYAPPAAPTIAKINETKDTALGDIKKKQVAGILDNQAPGGAQNLLNVQTGGSNQGILASQGDTTASAVTATKKSLLGS
jgi:hypothetical protein